jgi:hypothetical protein
MHYPEKYHPKLNVKGVLRHLVRYSEQMTRSDFTFNDSGTRLSTGMSESSSLRPDSLARIITCI